MIKNNTRNWSYLTGQQKKCTAGKSSLLLSLSAMSCSLCTSSAWLTLLLFPFLPVFHTGHGQCNCGRCDCKEGWAGKKCEHPLSCALSLESSTRKCRGASNLPCFGRGSLRFRFTCLLPWLRLPSSTLSSPPWYIGANFLHFSHLKSVLKTRSNAEVSEVKSELTSSHAVWRTYIKEAVIS